MPHNDLPASTIIAIANAEAVRVRLIEQIDSRQWWIVVVADSAGDDFLAAIEHQHYRGRASSDFELAIIPPGALAPSIVSIATAHKHRLSAGNLLRCLKPFIGRDELEVVRRQLPAHDILFPSATDSRGLAMRFYAFIDPAAAMDAALRN